MNYRCPICERHEAWPFLNRENVPVHQNFLFENSQQAIGIPRGKLNISVCHYCGFVFNADFDESLLSYDEKYENTQSYSPVFEKYLDDSIDYLVNTKDISNLQIIEIGCGKGYFLQKLVEKGGNNGIGFDPSYLGPLDKLEGKLRFRREFYDETASDVVADVVICRHVIEHIGNPLAMLRNVHRALANSPHAQVYFETPDVEWILKNQVVWDFFYEHCSYFNNSSIMLAFEKSGFIVDEIKNIFGNQYFWVEAHPTSNTNVHPCKSAEKNTVLALEFSEDNSKLLSLWRDKLIKMHEHGNIAIWGAGAKGVTFANLLDPTQNLISCVVDINPQKQNKFLPGTGHPIIGQSDLKQNNISSVIVLNPNYRQEIENLLAQSGVTDIAVYEFISGAV